MGASSRTLEVTVISGENLNVSEEACVVVRAESINSCTTKMAKDSGSGSLVSWNEKLLVDIPVHARSITFEVQSNKSKGARPVGVARIALSDFLCGPVPENCLQVLSYRLRDWEGKRNGVIHFAVRVAQPHQTSNPVKHSAEQFVGINVGDKNSSGVVAGVPLWWNYPNII